MYASKVLFADSSHPVLAPPVIMVKHICPSIEFIFLLFFIYCISDQLSLIQDLQSPDQSKKNLSLVYAVRYRNT